MDDFYNDLPLSSDDREAQEVTVDTAKKVFDIKDDDPILDKEEEVKAPPAKRTRAKKQPVTTMEEDEHEVEDESGAAKGIVIKADEVIEVEKESVKALKMLQNYLEKGWVDNFQAIEPYVKLTWLQNIPAQYIKTRELTKTVRCPYIPHEFAEKALNFIFNFNVSSEIVWKDGRMTADGKAFECEVEVKFTFKLPSGENIVKSVFAGHRSYTNAAITRADAYKSAASKAYTVVARQFGIGSNVRDFNPNAKAKNLSDMEAQAYEKAVEPEAKQEKSFDTNITVEKQVAKTAPSYKPAY